MSDPNLQTPPGAPRPNQTGGVPATANGDLHSLRRSVRANTEVLNPPENFTQPAPGEAILYPATTPTGSVRQVTPHPDATVGRDGTGGPDGNGEADDGAHRRGAGTRVVGAVLAWVPRGLLLLSVYQLLRLVPAVGPLPDLSLWRPLRVIGDGALAVAGLDSGWSDQAATLTIPVLGLLIVLVGNYLTPLWRGRRLRSWPYVLVIVACVAVLARGSIGSLLTQ